MLRVGIDYYETITTHPSHFRQLAETIIAGGGEVYIITAVEIQNANKVKEEISKTGVKYTDIDVVVYEDYDKVPEQKLLKAKERKIDFMIDDRVDTCQTVTNRGITGLTIMQRSYPNANIVSGERDNGRLETNGQSSRRNRGSGHLPNGGTVIDYD